MMSWFGIAAAGILNGSFAVPMKRVRSWKFEHIWGLFSIFAMVVLPWGAVLLAVPGWHAILATIPGRGLGILVTLGFFWGVTALLYGLAIDRLGIALGLSIQLGLSIVVGSLLPFARERGLSVRTPADAAFLAGVAMMVAGVIVCARAGSGGQTTSRDRAQFKQGLVIAVFGGLGTTLLNIGIQYGISLLPQTAASSTFGQSVAWAVLLSAAAVSQAGFCFYRILETHQMFVFHLAKSGHDMTLVLTMSVLWTMSIFLYGASAARLGRLGTSVGWPVFNGLIVVTSNAWGVSLGEWKGRPRNDMYLMIVGCAILVGAAFVIGDARAHW